MSYLWLTKRGHPAKPKRRPPIPGAQPHRDRKNDYRRAPKHRQKELAQSE